ncbi:hypothetical protein VNI00_008994 [Paramarasmius palmivorus]|uniref:F-box domain-containing protein n=1 Tax=Paramarasmius palmivorus TaxID=297713 RepID=A0AAW0CRA8_9AGAR
MDASGINKTSREYLETLFYHTIDDSHRKHVSQYMSSAEQKRNILSSEINKLKTEITRLEYQKKRLEKDMERYGSILRSPIRRMPPEILGHIFTMACEDNYIGPFQLPQAIVASNICRRWREVAMETPRMWSSMTIPFQEWERDLPRLPQIIQLFLERSKTSPLTLRMNFGTYCHVIPASVFDAVDFLVMHSHRWERLDFEGCGDPFFFPVFNNMDRNLPIMQHLGLTGRGHRMDGELIDIFQHARSLRSVAIKYSSLVDVFLLPRSTITTLQLELVELEILFGLLLSYDNLQHLEVSRLTDDLGLQDMWDPHFIMVARNTLRNLTIGAVDQSDICCLLRHSTFASLDTLKIAGVYDTPDESWPSWDNHTLVEFLRRSSCPITTLSLKWLPITEEQIIQLLRLLPAIENLQLEEFQKGIRPRDAVTNQFITNDFFTKCLSSTSSPTPALPRLTNLKLTYHTHKLDEDAVMDAVMSRMQPVCQDTGVACLASVSLTLIVNIPLPPGWKSGVDSKGRRYFCHALTPTVITRKDPREEDDSTFSPIVDRLARFRTAGLLVDIAQIPMKP